MELDTKLILYIESALSALLYGEEPSESCVVNIRRNGLRAIQLTQNYMQKRLLVDWLNSLSPHMDKGKDICNINSSCKNEFSDVEQGKNSSQKEDVLDDGLIYFNNIDYTCREHFKEKYPETILTFESSDGKTILSIVKKFFSMGDSHYSHYEVDGVKYFMLPKEFTEIEYRKITSHENFESAERAVRWLTGRHSLDEMRYFAIHRCWPKEPVTIADLNLKQEKCSSMSYGESINRKSGRYKWPVESMGEALEKERKSLQDGGFGEFLFMRLLQRAISLLDKFPEWEEKLAQAKTSLEFYEVVNCYLKGLIGDKFLDLEERELYDFVDLWMERRSKKSL